jgi:hypothetical protein
MVAALIDSAGTGRDRFTDGLIGQSKRQKSAFSISSNPEAIHMSA